MGVFIPVLNTHFSKGEMLLHRKASMLHSVEASTYIFIFQFYPNLFGFTKCVLTFHGFQPYNNFNHVCKFRPFCI